MKDITVSALYKFVTLDNLPDLKQRIYRACIDHEIKGTLLLATEGINGTIAGTAEDIYLEKIYFKYEGASKKRNCHDRAAGC